MRLRLAEVCKRSAHESVAHGGRALGEIAEHGDRAGGAAPADGAQLHGGEVLGLVEHHVAQARGAVQQVRDLVASTASAGDQRADRGLRGMVVQSSAHCSAR